MLETSTVLIPGGQIEAARGSWIVVGASIICWRTLRPVSDSLKPSRIARQAFWSVITHPLRLRWIFEYPDECHSGHLPAAGNRFSPPDRIGWMPTLQPWIHFWKRQQCLLRETSSVLRLVLQNKYWASSNSWPGLGSNCAWRWNSRIIQLRVRRHVVP